MVIIDEVEQCCIWNREQRQGGDSYGQLYTCQYQQTEIQIMNHTSQGV